MNKLIEHKNKVEILSSQIKNIRILKKELRIFHGRSHSTRSSKKDNYIDMTSFDNIISINKDKGYALVEPNVSMRRLVECTLKHGLIPSVVMEFPEITIGGGIQGGAGESSSFKYGLFNEICEEYELILGDGKIITTNSKLNEDLFYGTPCSCGTLGVLTLAKIKLVPAKPFVLVKYENVGSFQEMLDKMKLYTDVDYIDGIFYNKNFGVIISGKLSERLNLPIQTFSKSRDPWFYLHVKEIVEDKSLEELIPLTDYLFRYDRGAFWMGEYFFKFLHLPSNKFNKTILNPLLKTDMLYGSLQATNQSQKYFIQDISFPFRESIRALEFINNEVGIYPLWICPIKPTRKEKLAPNYNFKEMLINIGIWGELKILKEYKKINRKVEEFTRKHKGRKVFYAHNYYPKDQFWSIYDKQWYFRLRKKYKSETSFPDIYQKTYVNNSYKISIVNGIIEFIFLPFKKISATFQSNKPKISIK